MFEDDKVFALFYGVSFLIDQKVKDAFEPISSYNMVIFKLKILLFKYTFLIAVVLT